MKSLLCVSNIVSALCLLKSGSEERKKHAKTKLCRAVSSTPQVQSHTVISSGYIGVDTLWLLSLSLSLRVIHLLFAFIRFHFLYLFLSLLLWYKRHLLITKYSGSCSPHLSFMLEWPAWSPCARRKEQKLLPIVINASCNCMWHRDAILLRACESHPEEWKKD